MAYITVSATNISKPISTNSPSVSTGGCIRLTPSAPYSALRATSPHRLTQNSTREIGDTPHVVAVGDNRIGMKQSMALIRFPHPQREAVVNPERPPHKV